MKIEKISDKQIRCTLTREDLASRELKLSELAYGSDKAKELFQDMMRMAAQDFGFEADNMPLVIEAIPISMDAILLVITKVDDPEELDTRFSRFSSDDGENDTISSFTDLMERMEGADDIIDLIHRISEAKKQAAAKTAGSRQKSSEAEEPIQEDAELLNFSRLYLFRSLDNVIRSAGVLGNMFKGPNVLYKNPDNGDYYLILRKDTSPAEEFNKVCNILSEYAVSCKYSTGMDAYFSEHMEIIVPDQALQKLSLLT